MSNIKKIYWSPIRPGNKVLGSWGWIMSVAAALSAFGSLNGTFFSGGRVCFVAAREGHMPGILAMAHIHRLTPSPALIFTTIVSLLVLIPGDFQSIVNFFSFTAWFFYGITLSGLLYLKIKKPELPRPYRVPIILPILVLIVAVFLVLAPIIDDPQIEYLYVTLFILSGAIVYVPFIHYKLCGGLLNKLTVFLQLFLEVAPAEKNFSGFPLKAVSSAGPAFSWVFAAPLPRPTADSPLERPAVQHLEAARVHVCVLRPLAAPNPRLRNGLDAVVGPGDGPRHAGDGVGVPSQGQAVRYRPLQAAVVCREAFSGLQAVEDAEDGCGDRVERRNAVTWEDGRGHIELREACGI
ncbi:b(0,+)-type amino acid transporter 1 [Liparis tanakae]|uniref:B(0,+)-type amino acid transporter 1 n=1 Tax=Liparis tanakae TaxID=230148 RepID=A0A4Z2ILW5_9TELE|nr:b(0,+)-type amino acid transporter 1 [Liparis tanakae]